MKILLNTEQFYHLFILSDTIISLFPNLDEFQSEGPGIRLLSHYFAQICVSVWIVSPVAIALSSICAR